MNSAIHSPVFAQKDLCLKNGMLNPDAIGWSNRPQINCTLLQHKGRRKRWNHWCFTTPTWMLSVTQANLDYVGYGAAYFLDLVTGESASFSQMRALARGCTLPDHPQQSHAFSHRNLSFQLNEYPGRACLSLSASNLGGHPIEILLDIQRPTHLESVNLVAPMGPGTFHATCRQLGLPVSGSVQLGDRLYTCEAGHSFASMDFGRGVWPLNSHWKRAAFAAPGGIAGNFGTHWTDYSGLSENALWFGGELQQITHNVELTPLGKGRLANWRIETADKQVHLTFTPRQLHHASPHVGPLFADTRQWFGHFDGELLSPQGEHVPVNAALGWLGATDARW
ncbi:DUF2804 domain-containing protein [Pseudomonas sp. EL_65y_Pfl2_R95]|uniref:DUF2804 domain-containing protein n=1 Tax=Pseudomonas sp. EL_65y_Pfl2_R95 TaxID=3088698 RepID=UPI0030DD0A52